MEIETLHAVDLICLSYMYCLHSTPEKTLASLERCDAINTSFYGLPLLNSYIRSLKLELGKISEGRNQYPIPPAPAPIPPRPPFPFPFPSRPAPFPFPCPPCP